MDRNELTINVVGLCASGKSNLIYLLKNFLRDNGFSVNLGKNSDALTEEEFDKDIEPHFEKAIEAIRKTRSIVINEVQIVSNFVSNENV